MNYELLFLKSLALTIVIETVVLIIFFQFIVRLKEVKIFIAGVRQLRKTKKLSR